MHIDSHPVPPYAVALARDADHTEGAPVDDYSRVIAWLKVMLPLAALGILSTLFLFSNRTETNATIPFAAPDIRSRIDSQQITAPFFSGTTPRGDRIVLRIGRITSEPGTARRSQAEDVAAQIDLVGGNRVDVFAAQAQVDIGAARAVLSGAVRVRDARGIDLVSERVEIVMDGLELYAPQRIEGQALSGTFSAGSMRLTGDARPHLLFENGVRFLYSPKEQTP